MYIFIRLFNSSEERGKDKFSSIKSKTEIGGMSHFPTFFLPSNQIVFSHVTQPNILK